MEVVKDPSVSLFLVYNGSVREFVQAPIVSMWCHAKGMPTLFSNTSCRSGN